LLPVVFHGKIMVHIPTAMGPSNGLVIHVRSSAIAWVKF
jgi:hypothetical protein